MSLRGMDSQGREKALAGKKPSVGSVGTPQGKKETLSASSFLTRIFKDGGLRRLLLRREAYFKLSSKKKGKKSRHWAHGFKSHA